MTASVAGLSAVAPPPRGEETGALSPAHRGGLRVVSGPDRGLTQGADPASCDNEVGRNPAGRLRR